jgi:hypothetical protein
MKFLWVVGPVKNTINNTKIVNRKQQQQPYDRVPHPMVMVDAILFVYIVVLVIGCIGLCWSYRFHINCYRLRHSLSVVAFSISWFVLIDQALSVILYLSMVVAISIGRISLYRSYQSICHSNLCLLSLSVISISHNNTVVTVSTSQV